MPRIRIQDVDAVLGRVEAAIVSGAEEQFRIAALQLKDDFVRRIRAQDFESFRRVPLSWQWQQRKARMGWDPRVMIATGEYANSIQTFETRAKGKLTIRIGIHPSKVCRNPITGIRKRMPMWLMACVHEYGSSRAKVPARPHWHPFFQNFVENEAQEVGRRMMQAVRKKVVAATGGGA